MSTLLMLDALFPPSPDLLLRDMQAFGAEACAVYCWRPGSTPGSVDIGSWTPAHVQALRATRKRVLAIVVPLPTGGDPLVFLDAVRAMGFKFSDPVALDLEPPNLPPTTWEEEFDNAAHDAGFIGIDYSTQSNASGYVPDSPNWLAQWIETGTLAVIPAVPPGYSAQQFVNDVPGPVSGAQYDVSVIHSEVFPMEEEDMFLLRGSISGIVLLVGGGNAIHVPSPDDENALIAAGIKQIPVSEEMINAALSGVPVVNGQLTVSGTLNVK